MPYINILSTSNHSFTPFYIIPLSPSKIMKKPVFQAVCILLSWGLARLVQLGKPRFGEVNLNFGIANSLRAFFFIIQYTFLYCMAHSLDFSINASRHSSLFFWRFWFSDGFSILFSRLFAAYPDIERFKYTETDANEILIEAVVYWITKKSAPREFTILMVYQYWPIKRFSIKKAGIKKLRLFGYTKTYHFLKSPESYWSQINKAPFVEKQSSLQITICCATVHM